MDATAAINPKATTSSILRRFAPKRSRGEPCEFCSQDLTVEHRHVLEVATRKIVCACSPCALRFENVIGKWKLIPRELRCLSGFQMSPEQWEALSLPINLAFMYQSTPAGKTIALYPSPGGATESLLPLASWQALAAENPILLDMIPDVEALLVNRLGETRQYYIAPIDICFELVGLIRLHWRGLTGGERVWQEIGAFFAKLKDLAREVPMGLRHA